MSTTRSISSSSAPVSASSSSSVVPSAWSRPMQRVGERSRLLVDLLRHEVVVAVPSARRRRPRSTSSGSSSRVAPSRPHDRDRRPGVPPRSRRPRAGRASRVVAEQRGDVRGDEAASLEPRPTMSGDVRLRGRRSRPARRRRPTASAKSPRSSPTHRRSASARPRPGRELALEQVGDDLGVGLARSARGPSAASLSPQLAVVLDDAVVDDRHACRCSRQWGWAFSLDGRAVRRPARVADAGRTAGGGARGRGLERLERADRARRRAFAR